MDKLKGMFGSGHKEEHAAAAPSGSSGPAAQNVILHTTLGDINIALYANETPRVCRTLQHCQVL